METKEIPNYVKNFLQTAVIVDEKAFFSVGPNIKEHSDIKVPGRHNQELAEKSYVKIDSSSENLDALDTASIINSFLKYGIFCGVISDWSSDYNETIKKADIVVLDWYLEPNNPDKTLNILKSLKEELFNQDSLKIIAIYTGNQDFDDIREKIKRSLNLHTTDEAAIKPDIIFNNGRVNLYAKPGVNLKEEYENRSIEEEELPMQLVKDFASMTAGLLPGIALTSLAAVRENSFRVLNKFSSELDPAFLTQRVLISNPDEAEQQMVTHIGEELLCLMGDAVYEEKPAGLAEIVKWLDNQNQDIFNFGPKKNLNLEETIEMIEIGLDQSKLKNHKRSPTEGFSKEDSQILDKKLAWIMNSRAVYNNQHPKLDQGTIISYIESDEEKYLLCIRPSCDCVRIKLKTDFYFLRLSQSEEKNKRSKIVVSINGQVSLFEIDFKKSYWDSFTFSPDQTLQYVKAESVKAESDNISYYFKDTKGKRFSWIGQLKSEYTHRVSQHLASTLSRIGADESEWLRRQLFVQ